MTPPPLSIGSVWRDQSGVPPPLKNTWFAKNALIDFTGEFLHALTGGKLVVFTEPRLEGNGWRDQVLGGATDSTKSGRLPTIADAVGAIFGVDSTASKMSHFPVWLKLNRQVDFRARF